MVTMSGMGISLLSIIFFLYLILRRIIVGPEADGVFTLMAVNFFLIGATIMALGIIGEYTGRIYKQIQQRPHYIIRKIYEDGAKIDEEATTYILNLNPDIIFSFYFRRLIPNEIILKPRLGAYNLHGALLPKYRGQTCINWAVVNGETHTGATLHLMTEKADEGDIVDQRGFDIAFTDTSLDVFIKVSKIASEIIKDCLPKIEAGTITLTPQDDTQATKFGRRRPKDGLLDFSKDAISLYNLIRGVTHPFPGAFTYVNNKKLFIWWAKPIEGTGNIGEIVSTNPLCIGTGKGLLQLEKLQFENEAELDAKAFTDLLPIGTKFELE